MYLTATVPGCQSPISSSSPSDPGLFSVLSHNPQRPQPPFFSLSRFLSVLVSFLFSPPYASPPSRLSPRRLNPTTTFRLRLSHRRHQHSRRHHNRFPFFLLQSTSYLFILTFPAFLFSTVLCLPFFCLAPGCRDPPRLSLVTSYLDSPLIFFSLLVFPSSSLVVSCRLFLSPFLSPSCTIPYPAVALICCAYTPFVIVSSHLRSPCMCISPTSKHPTQIQLLSLGILSDLSHLSHPRRCGRHCQRTSAQQFISDG